MTLPGSAKWIFETFTILLALSGMFAASTIVSNIMLVASHNITNLEGIAIRIILFFVVFSFYAFLYAKIEQKRKFYEERHAIFSRNIGEWGEGAAWYDQEGKTESIERQRKFARILRIQEGILFMFSVYWPVYAAYRWGYALNKPVKIASYEISTIIIQLRLEIPVIIITSALAIFSAYMAYLLRCRDRIVYGALEIAFGVFNIVLPVITAANGFLIQGVNQVIMPDLRQILLQFVAGLYIVVRGLVNIHDAAGGRELSLLRMISMSIKAIGRVPATMFTFMSGPARKRDARDDQAAEYERVTDASFRKPGAN